MNRFDLVIFDNDGVLVDSEPLANRVLTNLLTSYGLGLTHEDCMARFVGSSMPRVRALAEGELGAPLPADFEDRYYAELFARFRQSLRPVDGIGVALGNIDIAKCVASSSSHERIELALQLTELWPQFQGRVFSSEDVNRGKPAPDLFILAANTLGVAPARSAVIEDSPLGIEAANAAGMTSFGFAGSTPKERLQKATGAVFEKMVELPRLLGVSGYL